VTQSTLLARLPATWRQFGAFLRAPQVLTPAGLRSPGAARTIGAMLALHLIGLAVIGLLMSGWMTLLGIEGPEAFAQLPPHYLVPLAVLGAPLIEESVFRGWLTGRPRALWLLLWLAAGIGLTVMAQHGLLSPLVAAGLPLAAALVGWIVLRKRETGPLFRAGFPLIFYASATVFGLIHVLNYTAPGLVHLPLVLPQLWAGLTLGFLRLRIGLPAAMLVHAVSNGLAVSLALASGEV
jgi:membrane protease YdiL (CAAX protease family)